MDNPENTSPTPEEIASARKLIEDAQQAEQQRQQAFIDEYNTLCERHGLQISVNFQLSVVEKPKPEA